MTPALHSLPVPVLPGRAAQRATRVAFFVIGFCTGAWAPLVPFAKARLHLSENALGLLLLSLGLGSIIAMPVAGALAARVGCRSVLIVSTTILCVVLPLLVVVPSIALFAVALVVFGASVGSADCVMNIQAIIVERASGRAMMSGFHGMFSVGGLVGAGGVSGLLSFGASPLVAIGCVGAVSLLALTTAARAFLPYGGERQGPAFALPHGIVLLIGALCFILFQAEGSVLDWSAVFLSTVRGMAPAHAGVGYTVFALAMTVGRLTGDAIVARLGGEKVTVLGGVTAATGMALAALAPAWQATLIGYLLVGVGCANIVPVLFTAAGRQRVMPENIAVPAITTLGYTGMLVGPAAIGFIAQAASLSMAFLCLALLLLGVAASGRLVPTERM